MAVATAARTAVKETPFIWEGVDKMGRKMKGEMLAPGEAAVRQNLRRQGITATKIKKQGLLAGAKKITEKDIALFTRQLSTMVKAGVPLLQSFDITSRSHGNPALQKLLGAIKSDVESGTALNQAFRRHPKYFDDLYCNLVEAGEQAGILEAVLDRIATYKEKILAIKGKIKSALMYPAIVIVVAFIITAGLMIFVIPVFAELFEGSGAELPALTALVMRISDFFVAYWWLIFGVFIGSIVGFLQGLRRSPKFRDKVDAWLLKMPVFGPLVEKATVAKWSRTFSAMFAAGVPMVETLDSVAGAAGNAVYRDATQRVKIDVAAGASLNSSLLATARFPVMLTQMVAIGEESGSLDAMVDKVADFYEREVDEMVDQLSSLMEPMIMVILGSLIGTIVVAMYLPIFKLGTAF
jgi:type IV pilus assembly protein PilC